MNRQPSCPRPPGTDLGNWRTTPYSRWAFQNTRELVPSALIAAARGAPEMPRSTSTLPVELSLADGLRIELADWLATSETDSLLVARDGRVLGEWHAPHADPARPHILFSVSKSLTAILAGILEGEGLIDSNRVVAHYLPGTRDSAYGDATLRNLLDMNVALGFEEDYLNPSGDYFRYRNATCWNPVDQTGDFETLEAFLYTLPKAGFAHGERFNYKSPNTDLLGLIVERVAGIPYADLMSECLWQPMGAADDAYVTVDRGLLARGAGGVCAVIDDLARVGQLMLDCGSSSGRQVVPEAWVMDTRTTCDRAPWLQGDFTSLLPNGGYRSQWYQFGDPDGCFCAIGIHGQWMFSNPATRVVVAKLSSQSLPVDEPLDHRILAVLHALSRVYDA